MNPLARLKEKMIGKPTIKERQPVFAVIKGEEVGELKEVKEQDGEEEEKEKDEKQQEEQQEESIEKKINKKTTINKSIIPIIFDETDANFDRNDLYKKIKEKKQATVTKQPIMEISENKQAIEPIQPSNKIKKTKKRLIIEEDEEDETNPIELNKKVEFKETPLIIEPEKLEEEEELIPIKVSKPKKRITEKPSKGIAILGPETVVDIGDTDLRKRLPIKSPPVLMKVSNYYMNDREIFVNFINSLFEPYREELQSNTENISCDIIGKKDSDFSLLTHQKIVRDYMNLYTPYRGLLLYHGLGSGKTCTSIAIAEGMKDTKKIIIMTPASLQKNYIEQLKECGDLLYKRNQYWEWISIIDHADRLETLSAILNLPMEYIRKHNGAFFVNIKKRPNYTNLTDEDRIKLEEQLNIMIKQKYTFINYNGLRAKKLRELTFGFTRNLFDNSVIIIDEAHNLISRIVNKLKKEKEIPENKKGEKEHLPLNLSVKLYELLLSAKNARIVLLTGTPVINYPNEFGILFNILRGYIKTWKIPLNVKTNKKIDKNVLEEMLIGEKTLNYIDYSPSSKTLTITRNPFGFKNKIGKESGYQGVNNVKKGEKNVLDDDFISDDDFERKIISILRRNDIDVVAEGIHIKNKKALPDKVDDFVSRYIDSSTLKLKNTDALKRRIIGLSSYFKSAQESLLPTYNKQLGVDYHIIRIPMSDTQFKIYESARHEERELERKKPKKTSDELFEEKQSTYRIFSRLYCNFVLPNRPTPKLIKMEKFLDKMLNVMSIDATYNKLKQHLKPTLDVILDKIVNEEERMEWNKKIENELHSYVKDLINAQKKGTTTSDKKLMNIMKDLQKVNEIVTKTKKNTKINKEELENISKKLEDFHLDQTLIESEANIEENPEENDNITNLLMQARREESKQDIEDEHEGEIEGDEILDKLGGNKYKEQIENMIKNVKEHANDFLTPEALQTYSPKFLHMLENIQDASHEGLHLVYSQFRTLEGIGLFSLVLEKNGFAQFKIKKTSLGVWEIDINEADEGKPTYALYTGTETAEEKEIIRRIYNGEWDEVPESISKILKKKHNNNNLGEIIKVFMITSSGSEGINLKNTRYVHIMEPYWHPVRTEQVIGRARRICSHKSLPKELQTVEVFIYLMIFSETQLKSDEAIELKRRDLSKSIPQVPLTSDQYLYEISEIKAGLTNQLTDAIKESAFDCYIYSNGKCINFGDPTNDKFSYVPDFSEQQNDTTLKANKVAIEWEGKIITLNGKQYVYRRINKKILNIYDKSSYESALKDPSIIPLQVGTLETNERGEKVFKAIV